MSRCFPYPPPGYTLSKNKFEALIKLENERQKIKEQKKKEKKEKRRDKTKKHKEKKHISNGFLHKTDISNGHVSRIMLAEDKLMHKRTDFENEQFDGSSLTEEHGASISHSSSSDSSNTGNKRKRHFSHSNGKDFLVQFPSGKQNHFDAYASDKEQTPCTSARRTGFFVQNKDEFHLRNFSQRSDDHKPAIKSVPESIKTSPMQRTAQEYKKLFENWVPPLKLQDLSFYSDDLDWLFDHNKNREVPPEKRNRSGSEAMSCSRSSSLWPLAEYLHEANMYALPLTIPF